MSRLVLVSEAKAEAGTGQPEPEPEQGPEEHRPLLGAESGPSWGGRQLSLVPEASLPAQVRSFCSSFLSFHIAAAGARDDGKTVRAFFGVERLCECNYHSSLLARDLASLAHWTS